MTATIAQRSTDPFEAGEAIALRPPPPPPPGTGPTVILVGGVPGAGKTTLLARLHAPGVRVVDPEGHRRRLATTLPGVPYRWYRPIIHTLHATIVVATLLRGPRPDGTRAVVIHEPGTRPRRNALLARLARARGWRPVLLMIDVDRETALSGQHARGRVLRPGSFDGHCRRWADQRRRLHHAAAEQLELDGWQQVRVTTRERAGDELRQLLG